MTNPSALALSLALVLGSLVISVYARRRTQTVLDFYLAGRRIGAFANASAICGDYFSAASFLGVAAAVYVSGLDGVWFATGFGAGFLPVLLFVAAPLRRFGAYTIPEFLGRRFRSRAVRWAAVAVVLLIVFMYLVPQMIGLGETWSVAIGVGVEPLGPYETGMAAAALAIAVYVALGGMRATTWQQIFFFWFFFSAVVLVLILTYSAGFAYLPALAELADDPLASARAVGTEASARWQVQPDPNRLHPERPARFGEPGHRYGPVEQVSVVLGLVFGTCGLPHITMRFLTSPTGRAARDAGAYTLALAALYYAPAVAVGVAARALLPGLLAADARYAGLHVGGVLKTPEQAVLLLAALLGGDPAMGYVAAGAFAAILSTVSGLLLAGAASLSHDVYAADLAPRAPERRQVLVGRLAVAVIGLITVVLGVAAKRSGIMAGFPSAVAVMVSWAFAVAGGAFFPALVGAIWWRRATAAGALAAIAVGGGGTLALIGLHLAATAGLLGGPAWLEGLAGLSHPSIITVPAATLALVVGSLCSRPPEGLDADWVRMHGTAAERQLARLARASGVTTPAGGVGPGPAGG